MRRGRAIPNRQRFDDARGSGTGEGIFFVSVPARVRRSVGSSSGVARVRTAAVGLGCETLLLLEGRGGLAEDEDDDGRERRMGNNSRICDARKSEKTDDWFCTYFRFR